MPIRKEPNGKRSVEMQLIVNATPEQVWAAVATGAGNSAWFTKATIEERVGGALRFDMGPLGGSSGEVTAWEPPLRFGYVEREWAEGAPPVATEITVEGRANGTCVIRMVHSLFCATDEWDDQVEGFESGWPGFFEVLKTYLAHFAGAPAASFIARVETTTDERGVWARLLDILGAGGANVGDRFPLRGSPEPVEAVVSVVHQSDAGRWAVLRLSGDAPGVLYVGTHPTGEGSAVGVCRYVYADGASTLVDALEPAWQDWLTRGFAAAR